jgi:hypothetical protein
MRKEPFMEKGTTHVALDDSKRKVVVANENVLRILKSQPPGARKQ